MRSIRDGRIPRIRGPARRAFVRGSTALPERDQRGRHIAGDRDRRDARRARGDAADPAGADGATTARHIRGSSLLFGGRLFALGIDFVAQVLIVRHLAKDDYGAWALALSFAALGTSVSLLGLERTIGRFAAVYHEQADYGRVWGTLVLVFATVVGLGALIVLGVYAGQGLLGGFVDNRLALSLLLVVIVLSPIQALDSLLIASFATFASARAIFWRRHVLAPLLQLSVVVALLLTGSDVHFLAVGWVAAGAFGVALYIVFLWRVLARAGLVDRLRRASLRLPARELFGFALPLLASDLVFVLRTSVIVIILEALHSVTEVAEFRAVLPLAAQNLLVSTSFRYLYTPQASRLFARQNGRGVNDLYWQTAVWIAVATFPVLAVTVALAEPVTVLLFGEQYREAGVVLAALAVGHYIHGSLGFNALTLRVYGRVRYMVTTDLITAAISLVMGILLIRAFGALGAAVAVSASLLLQNAFYQFGLRRLTPVRAIDRQHVPTYLSVWGVLAVLVAVNWVLEPPLVLGLLLVAAGSLVVFLVNRDRLRVLQTFPELARLPFARVVFGG